MNKEDLQVNFRMPRVLKEELQALADASKRSLTSEIVDRLEGSFSTEVSFNASMGLVKTQQEMIAKLLATLEERDTKHTDTLRKIQDKLETRRAFRERAQPITTD